MDFVDRLIGYCAAALLFVMTWLMAADVAGRYIFATPLPGAYELIGLTLAGVVFLGLPLCTARREHIEVGLFNDSLGPRLKAARGVLADSASAVAFAVISWRLWVLGGSLMKNNEGTIYLKLPLGSISYFEAVLTGAAALLHLWLALAAVRRVFARR